MAEIEWRAWQEVSDELLLRAMDAAARNDCFVHVVERVRVGAITCMGQVHEVERDGSRVVRPSIIDDADVYLIDILGPEVLPWPAPVPHSDLVRRAEADVRDAQEILDEASVTLAQAQEGLDEARRGLEVAAEKLRRLKGGA